MLFFSLAEKVNQLVASISPLNGTADDQINPASGVYTLAGAIGTAAAVTGMYLKYQKPKCELVLLPPFSKSRNALPQPSVTWSLQIFLHMITVP